MASIGFIGLGNMGRHMAANLIKAGHRLQVFDLNRAAVESLTERGASSVATVGAVAIGVDAVITMLPAGPQVAEVYIGAGGLLDKAAPGTLLIDSSTIDVATARDVARQAEIKGLAMVDAPVSGGVGGAEAGRLTFMVGGSEADFARAKPILDAMGKTIVHVGGAGNGQAAKICNNMILGISMVAVSEAFALAEKLGLAAETLFAISSNSSGQCWAMTSYCPAPGPVATAPSNRDYRAGFAAAMMLKDMRLAQAAAQQVQAWTPLGDHAMDLYSQYCDKGHENLDFSGIYTMIVGKKTK